MNEAGFRRAFIRYVDCITSNERKISQRQADDLFDEAAVFVPHARLDELHSFDEVERDYESIMDEAIRRENVFEASGELAALLDIRAQQVRALDRPSTYDRHRINARNNIGRIDRALARLQGTTFGRLSPTAQ